MKKVFLCSFLLILLILLPVSSFALLFNFGPLSNEGGTGTATMDITITGNVLTAVVNNTSPIDLDSPIPGGGGNSPGITGFGFNLDPDSLILASWSLKAHTDAANTTEITIGSGAPGEDWEMETFLAGITLDYLPNNGGNINGGALFNPAAFNDVNNELPGGGNPVYFTTATLVMNFNQDQDPSLNIADEWSPFVRMQNVGINGDGSLKLPGDPIPEPTTIVLFGVGLIGLAGLGRKKFRK